ncbi:hypothetical protein GCM10009799_48820 [Nocardiopsis rhodophaea]|uniref:Orc1-like AAA ATPase domain-containing protein n=1 Tax=Nocardiopsis rhodophaea TaxID=280238 RepID=A0ABN2TNA1_9ACTN
MTALVGRERESALLEDALVRTLSSHGGLVFVTGDTGIGKTALVADAMARAGRRGALVATGTCWDREGTPGYWPWIQVLRGLRRSMSAQEWDEVRAMVGNGLASLLGETGQSDHEGAGGGDAFAIQDAVTTFLVTVSRRTPVVVVLDDLHWADPSSIGLLEFVTRHAWFEQLLIIGIYRDIEVEGEGHRLGALLPPLLTNSTSITLVGLDYEETRVLLTRATGRQPSRELAGAVHRRTGGNPFFVEQTAHLWQSGGSVASVDRGVRGVVEHRLNLLPEGVVELLTAASVLGLEFERDVLAEMMGRADREVDASLAEAVKARLAVHKDDPGRIAFVHDLVRGTLYANMAEAEARHWHAAAARAFRTLPAKMSRSAPGEVARHAYLGVPIFDPQDAAVLLRSAAQDAWDRMATGEASVHLSRALSLLPRETDPREWAEVALHLGSTQHHVGDEDASLRTFQEVAEVARGSGHTELLMRAALRMRGAVWLAHAPEVRRLTADLVNEAYTAFLGDSGTAATDSEREQELTAVIVELARGRGDDQTLIEGLMARHDAIWSLRTAAERQAIAEELGEAAARVSDRSVALLASLWRAMALLEQGDPAGRIEQRSVTEGATGSEPSASSWTAVWSQVAFGILAGKFDEARACLEAAEENERINREGAEPQGDLELLRFHQRWTLEVAQGNFDAADDLVRNGGADEHPYSDLLLGVTAAERGDTDIAQRYLTKVLTPDESSSRWIEPMRLRLRAQVAAGSGNREARARVREDLAPLQGHWLTMYGASLDGPVAFWSALLDAADGAWDAAVDGFVAAVRAADRLEARTWSIRARTHLAKALAARGAPGDRERARELSAGAEQEAVWLGVTHLLLSDPDAQHSVPQNAFTFDGQVWTLTFGGVTAHLPDAKGLRDLHVLLGRPGRAVSAIDLLSPSGGAVVRNSRRLGADPVLDERAKSAYRTRLSQLDEQIEEALARGEDERAAELDNERNVLIEEIRRAAGLHGRTRRLGDSAERARKAVTERIRNALRRMDDQHPVLAEHLRQCVATGSSCQYDPPEPTHWHL